MNDYINHIDNVAKALVRDEDWDAVWRALSEAWGRFEGNAKLEKYEVLETDKFKHNFTRIAGILYRFPNATAARDCDSIRVKDADYGGSWCMRGGCGAFMMLARKWDRIHRQVKVKGSLMLALQDQRAEGIMDDIADLRCYLILCLAYLTAKECEF